MARHQREKVLKAGKPLSGKEVATGLAMGGRVGCFLLLVLVSLVVAVFAWPIGLLLLFLLALAALMAH